MSRCSWLRFVAMGPFLLMMNSSFDHSPKFCVYFVSNSPQDPTWILEAIWMKAMQTRTFWEVQLLSSVKLQLWNCEGKHKTPIYKIINFMLDFCRFKRITESSQSAILLKYINEGSHEVYNFNFLLMFKPMCKCILDKRTKK